MNYLPRDICEKLVEKGCKSESGFYYIKDYLQESVWQIYGNEYTPIKAQPLRFSAFIFQDFCGISERAIENCKILWPKIYCWRCKSDYLEGRICPGSNFSLQCAKTFEWEVVRRESLKKAWDEWVEFMRRAVG